MKLKIIFYIKYRQTKLSGALKNRNLNNLKLLNQNEKTFLLVRKMMCTLIKQ